MKKIKMIILLAALTVSVAAFAQSRAHQGGKASNAGWSSVYFQYNPMTLAVDIQGYDDLSFNGFTFGYNKAYGIAGNTPLYIEVGGSLLATFYSDSEDGDDISVSMVSVKVPASLVYKWQVSNTVAILPYAGLTARFNVLGKESSDNMDDDINLFDKKDMGSKDATWKRLQLGYQIGANVMFNNQWHLGLAYGSDFSEICKKEKFNTTSLTIGYDF
jgi:hypothetical protein